MRPHPEGACCGCFTNVVILMATSRFPCAASEGANPGGATQDPGCTGRREDVCERPSLERPSSSSLLEVGTLCTAHRCPLARVFVLGWYSSPHGKPVAPAICGPCSEDRKPKRPGKSCPVPEGSALTFRPYEVPLHLSQLCFLDVPDDPPAVGTAGDQAIYTVRLAHSAFTSLWADNH